MRSRTIVVTASDEKFFPLASELLSSIEAAAPTRSFDVGVLDLGLSPQSRVIVARRAAHVVTPQWDYPLTMFRDAPANIAQNITARAHLPRHFPGYDTYMWIDADAWVQRLEGIELYISAAEQFGFTVTPECDRSYAEFYGSMSVLDYRLGAYRLCFNDDLAMKLALFPTINAGVFAARRDAPHWQRWSEVLGELLKIKREIFFLADQNALNAIIRAENLPAAFLPATCNWMCNRALPRCSEDGTMLLESNPPFVPLAVVHMTANSKELRPALLDIAGTKHVRSLRYSHGTP